MYGTCLIMGWKKLKKMKNIGKFLVREKDGFFVASEVEAIVDEVRDVFGHGLLSIRTITVVSSAPVSECSNTVS